MSILKKSLLTFFAFLILSTGSLTLFASSAHAQWYKPTFFNFIGLVEGPDRTELYGERYTAAQVRWIMYSLLYVVLPQPVICIISATSNPPVSLECIDSINSLFASNTSPSSSLASTLSTSPISSTTYFKTVGQRLHIIPEAQAQGFGFEAGSLIFNLWEAARNTAYALLIIVVVIMAFMIMFRVKLSPQTVISVQSALPKVIVSLILITFSYAIAGLLIDLMYVSIGLLTTILRSSGIIEVSTATWGDTFGELTYNNGALELMIKYWALFQIALISAMFSSIGGAIFGTALFAAIFATSGILGIIILLIALIVVLILGFKVWWMLIKNFIFILFSIVLGPFQILSGTLGSGGFGPWAKNLIGLLAVYPVTGFMFVLSFVFLRGAYENGVTGWLNDLIPGNTFSNLWTFDVAPSLSNTNAWAPPLTGSPHDLNLLWLAASIAIIALIPKVSEMVKGWASGRPLAYGTAIGEGLAFATGAGGFAVGAGKSAVIGQAGLASAKYLTTPNVGTGRFGRAKQIVAQGVTRYAESQKEIVQKGGGGFRRPGDV